MTDKRENARIPILGLLTAEIMVFAPMMVKEVSLRGATVETRFPLFLDSLHDLRLSLGDRSIVVKGRVAHSHVSDMDQELVTYHSGLEFIEPSAHASAAIREFLDSLTANRAGV